MGSTAIDHAPPPDRVAAIDATAATGTSATAATAATADPAPTPNASELINSGVTTTCESLYVGVPVISLYGRNGVSRSGLSLLGTLGLGELTASSPEQYVEIAVALGSDLSRLEQLRESLRARFEQSSLRGEKRFTAKFEELLRTAWRQHQVHSK